MARKKRVKKEIVEKVEEIKPDKLTSRKQDMQLKWIIIWMAIIILVALGVYLIVQEMKKFEYGGLEFEKIMFDKLPLYHSKIPIMDSSGKLVANYNLYFRNDPRELRNISITGKIGLMPSVVVSLDPEADAGCSDSSIAGANFFGFLKTAGFKITLAYNNESYAEKKDAMYAICNENVSHSTIIIKKGSEDKITQDSLSCYTLEFADCDILKVTERFMTATFAHSKGIEI